MAEDLIGSPSNSHDITADGFEPKQSHTNLADSPSLITLFPFSTETARGFTENKENNK